MNIKKYLKYLIFISVLVVIPLDVLSYELVCNSNTINYDEALTCYLNGDNFNNYEEISGNLISTDNLINCTSTGYVNGLSPLESDYTFSFSGNAENSKLITFTCSLNEKLKEVKRTQIKIENFHYKFYGDENYKGENEIISTDFINANIYNEEEEDDKPRDTSNPSSLLKSITESNFNLVFSKFITIYNQEVLNEVSELNIDAIPNSDKAKIQIFVNGEENNKTLNIGKNVVDIYVYGENKSVTCYTINVTRLNEGESIYYPEKDATLFSLIVKGYAISFNKEKDTYNIHLDDNVSSINVFAVPTYEEATVSISSTENLKNGSVVKITVTSKDKSVSKDYLIKISKDLPKANYSSYYIFGGIVLLLLILVILFLKTSQTKKKKKENQNNIDSTNLNNNISKQVNESNNNIDNSNNVDIDVNKNNL